MGYCSVKQLKEVLNRLDDNIGINIIKMTDDIGIVGDVVAGTDEVMGSIILGTFCEPDATLDLAENYKHIKL